jgi:hypothetical protein
MRPPEMFGIVVRVFGLAISLYSLWLLLSTIALSLEGLGEGTAWFAFMEIAALVVGIYLLRGAPIVVRFSYPHEKP